MARQFNTDCEGVISKNDNAQEFCVDVLGEGELDGAGFFARISRYDDFLADAEHKKGYKAGDTLRLILPFLRACGATNAWLAQYSMDNILLVPGAKETLDYIRQRMESFIISTSYSPYIEMLCEAIGFPPENAYSTELDMDQYEIPEALARRLRALAQEILILPLIEIPDGAGSLDDLSPESQGAVRRLDDIFWRRFFSVYPLRSARNDAPNLFPIVEVVRDANREELIAVSEAFRQTVRGKEIGALG